ncbi:MAG: UDP-N-acetylmuramoyl-tripeptide--D-alanyl-D-alanine ligase, partial [Pseudomonadota bacterium]
MSGFKMNLAEAARAVHTSVKSGWENIPLAGISTDSRTIRPGELFVALRGGKYDGHDFLKDIFARGASAAVVAYKSREKLPGPRLVVPDTLYALGELAVYLRLRPRRKKLEVLAVTGSNGKTTTKEMLVRILSRKCKVLANKGNFNNRIGLPLTLFGLRPNHEAAVLEMGANEPGEIARLTQIAHPDAGLVTNVGPAHLEGLGGITGVARAKGELFQGLDEEAVAVINLDDPQVVRQAGRARCQKLTFGLNPQAEVRGKGLSQTSLKGSGFTLVTPEGQAKVNFPLLGRHNVLNALAAAAGALALGLGLPDIAAGLEGFAPFPGRLELKVLSGPIYLLDDTYNANPASTAIALEVLTSSRGKGRTVAVLGDMLEMGWTSRDQHRQIGKAAADLGVDV